MIVKNIHEKLLDTIKEMLIDTVYSLPYYGEFNLHINFEESNSLPTCGVNVSSKGMNFYYNPGFLDKLSQKEVNFVTIHEDFHLLFNHPRRTLAGGFDHKLSNIAQDMIINHIIWEDINHDFVEIPKDDNGRNMALFVPKEYDGKLIFEELYAWLREEKEKWDKSGGGSQQQCQSCGGTGKKQKGQGQGDNSQPGQGQGKGQGEEEGDGQGGGGSQQNDQAQGGGNQQGQGGGGHDEEDCTDCDGTGNQDGKDSTGKPSYGPYGKNPKGGNDIDTWSKEQIFQDMEKNEGQYMDVHMGDDVPEAMRDAMVREVTDRLEARGFASGDITTTLNKLQKKRKDYLKEIKRSVSNMIFGHRKMKTIVKPNRRGIKGLKGNRKVKTKINVILDTSGSMGGQGTFERVLSYVYQNDIEMNFIQGDTQVKWVENFKKKRQLETMKIHGLGGTILQPSVDYVVEHHNDCNTVILTDGYTDTLDLSRINGKVLCISVGTEVPLYSKSKKGTKQVVLDETH